MGSADRRSAPFGRGSVRSRARSQQSQDSESHDVESGVHEQHIPGHTAAKIAGQEHGAIRNFSRIGIPAERRMPGDGIQHL